jgi:hypothetical protein
MTVPADHSSVGIVEFLTHLVTLFGPERCYRRSAMPRDRKKRVPSIDASSHVHPDGAHPALQAAVPRLMCLSLRRLLDHLPTS